MEQFQTKKIGNKHKTSARRLRCQHCQHIQSSAFYSLGEVRLHRSKNTPTKTYIHHPFDLPCQIHPFHPNHKEFITVALTNPVKKDSKPLCIYVCGYMCLPERSSFRNGILQKKEIIHLLLCLLGKRLTFRF